MYRDASDLVRRVGLSQASIALLAESGMLESITGDRRAAYWQALTWIKSPRNAVLHAADADDDELIPSTLKSMSKIEEVYADYSSTGLSLRVIPLSSVEQTLNQLHVTTAEKLSRFEVVNMSGWLD